MNQSVSVENVASRESVSPQSTGAVPSLAPAPPRFSTPTRIFFGFIVVVAAFALVAVGSLLQHARTARTLRLLDEGYLPLALVLGEAKATQTAVGTFLDRVLEERDSAATQSWLRAALRVRPATLDQALKVGHHARKLPVSTEEGHVLDAVLRKLEEAQQLCQHVAPKYEALFEALRAGNLENAAKVLRTIRSHEAEIARHFRSAWSGVQQRIATTSSKATEEQNRAIGLLATLVCAALLVGAAVSWWSQRVLQPLPALHRRVAAFAAGDQSNRLEPRSNDELGRLTAEFERMVDRVVQREAQLVQSERLAAIGRLAAHVTHEVRNPLSSIGLNVELLEEEMRSSNQETKALLAAIHKEIDRLTALTEQYLRLARVPESRLETENLTDFVRDLAAFMKKEWQEHHIELVLDVQDNVPSISLDEGQMRQALLNLLRNAQQAMPAGGRIFVRIARSGQGVSLSIRDEGPGIAEKDRARIFDPFFTTKAGGTGLGLPLTQQIIVAHGGTIRCTTHSEGGGLFELWFPSSLSLSGRAKT